MKGMATHSSILAWRIPWTVSSMVSQKESDTTEQPLSLSYAVYYILVTYSVSNWRFISLSPLHLCHPPPTPFLLATSVLLCQPQCSPFLGHVAHRILVPDQGWKLCPLQWKHGVLTAGPQVFLYNGFNAQFGEEM